MGGVYGTDSLLEPVDELQFKSRPCWLKPAQSNKNDQWIKGLGTENMSEDRPLASHPGVTGSTAGQRSLPRPEPAARSTRPSVPPHSL